jgi:hypothetical protein
MPRAGRFYRRTGLTLAAHEEDSGLLGTFFFYIGKDLLEHISRFLKVEYLDFILRAEDEGFGARVPSRAGKAEMSPCLEELFDPLFFHGIFCHKLK